jgi:hypothetical protein
MTKATFFHHDDADLDLDDLLRPEKQFSTPWGDAEHGACDKCSGSGSCHYRCLSCIENGPTESCPACDGRVEFDDVCPVCEGSGEISRTKRAGVSVFPTRAGLYRYLVEKEAELENSIVVELTGELSADRDLDADSGAILVYPREIVSCASVDQALIAEMRGPAR